MSGSDVDEFSNVIREIIKKSLFTERQIEIILRKRSRSGSGFGISRGAYYRQLGQSKMKLARVYYTVALLWGVGILERRDIDVMLELAKHVGALKDSDVFPEREADVVTMFERIIKQACRL